MASNFKYATQSDLQNYFNRFGDFDQKMQIYNAVTDSNLHQFHNCGLVQVLFINGDEVTGAENTDEPNANGEWRYIEEQDVLQYYDDTLTATTIHEAVVEAGLDFSTFIDQQLVNASLELNNLLSKRFPMPLEKAKQIDIDTATNSVGEEYDPIIIKCACYIAASNLIRSKSPSDQEADYYYSLVSNPEGTGFVDRINDGHIKLSFEIKEKSSKGSIKYRNVSGSIDIVELYGDYSGEPYDLLKVEVEATGAYGVGTFKVHHYSNDKIFGDVTDPEVITGGLQQLYGGLFGRFSGASATDGDIWEIEVYSDEIKSTNTKTDSIRLYR
tara:strand:- start:2158 stop:3138 length:981 start_codon:yes stop_codon:yes gene_type:complete